MKKIVFCLLGLLLLGAGIVTPTSFAAKSQRHKVFVVFSYEEDASWDVEIREEIVRVLAPHAELTFFYMNTKTFLEGGSKKAEEAFSLYQKLKPDGVIAVDDNAQSMFVVPYLKGKIDIPVMFCGVNAKPETYGYPTEHISGILERFHLEESIILNRQLVGQINNFAFMVKKGPVADILAQQLEEDKDQFSARMIRFMTPESLEEALSMAKESRENVDLLFLVGLFGLKSGGVPGTEKDAIPRLVAAFNKPTAGIAASVVRFGALSAVITNSREHGYHAATMLLKAMSGTPLSQLPVRRNSQGERMINVTTLKGLGLSPDPIVLRGVELVRQW